MSFRHLDCGCFMFRRFRRSSSTHGYENKVFQTFKCSGSELVAFMGIVIKCYFKDITVISNYKNTTKWWEPELVKFRLDSFNLMGFMARRRDRSRLYRMFALERLDTRGFEVLIIIISFAPRIVGGEREFRWRTALWLSEECTWIFCNHIALHRHLLEHFLAYRSAQTI